MPTALDLQGMLARVRHEVADGDAAIVDTGDWHKGSVLASWPDGVALDKGNKPTPNKVQQWVAAREQEWWKWADDLTKGRRRVLICHGDLVEGRHDGMAELVTPNMLIQRRAAIAYLDGKRRDGDAVIVMRGTPRHVGDEAENEEAIGEALGAMREPLTGAWSWYVPRLRCNGVELVFAHHIGRAYSPVTKASALVREMVNVALDVALWGSSLPDVMGFAHRHEYVAVQLPGRRQGLYCYTIPSWCAKTEYAMKILPTVRAHVGGVVLLIDKDGSWRPYPRWWALPEQEAEVV